MAPRTLQSDLPMAAAGILFLTGGLAILTGLLLLVLPIPRYIGVDLPAIYRILVASMAMLGGGAHLVAGWWTWQRRYLFRVITATLVGMVLLQISFPLDLMALGLLGLGRRQFDADHIGGRQER